MRKLHALVVDDVLDMAQTIANDLEAAGFETTVTSQGAMVAQHLATQGVDVVITDLRLKGKDGLEVLAAVKKQDPTVPVIIMTAFGAIETAVEAMRCGAFSYLAKPFALETLRALVERACRERVLSQENAELRQTLRETSSSHRLLGESAAIRQLRELIARVADSSSSVLISGETGTGKELVALAVHGGGDRADKPFVAINCAALPEHLLESEIFGHARGAFTGALQARRGLFLEADEGTLLLDEIGDLPLQLQGKLLRVLQSGEVRPIGSETSRIVNVRVLAATHKDLGELVRRGLFREDLFFRLDVLRVAVPPLRERADDIPLLADHFLGRSLARSPRSPLVGLAPEAMDFLCAYAWPGNVRQLENLIERLVVTASGTHATAEDVRHALAPAREIDPLAALLQRPMTLQELENRYIDGVLATVEGSKQRAAEILGLDLSTLYRRSKTR